MNNLDLDDFFSAISIVAFWIGAICLGCIGCGSFVLAVILAVSHVDSTVILGFFMYIVPILCGLGFVILLTRRMRSLLHDQNLEKAFFLSIAFIATLVIIPKMGIALMIIPALIPGNSKTPEI